MAIMNLPCLSRIPGRRLLPFCLLFGLLNTADGAMVPDLLEQPAQLSKDAGHSLQLAVAAAGDRLVSVGVRGIVLLSDDQGRNWRQADQVPVSVALTDVDFVSATHGWAVGHSGVVLASTDGGNTWQRQLDGQQAATIVLDEVKARQAKGVELGKYELSDAERLVEEGPDKPFLAVDFQTEQRGYVVGAYGLAFYTDDGGASWQSLMGRIPNPRGKHLYQIRSNDADLLIAGEQGALFRSHDAGDSFLEIQTPYEGTFFGALETDHNRLLAYGLRGNAWLSTDDGASWQQIEIDQQISLPDATLMADGSVILADESGRLLRSTDGGQGFAVMNLPAQSGLTCVFQAHDGALVISSARGVTRFEISPDLTETSHE